MASNAEATTDSGWDERLARGRGNSFDLARLVLASLVILEHSFFLIDGRMDRDPLYVLSGGQANCGALAVYLFFVISGFLVTRSWLTDPNLPRYLARRVARIVPAFIVATAAGFLLVGPLAASSATQYFFQQNWIAVIVQTLALKQAGVSGTLAHNPIPLVHGTLWTIQYEFDCYLAVALLGLAGLLTRWPAPAFAAIAIGLVVATVFQNRLPVIDFGWPALLISSPRQWPTLFPFFFVGAAFYVFRKRIPKSSILFWLTIAVLIASALFGHFYLTSLICGAYAVLFFALSTETSIKIAGKKVDLSYGIYLYGWPIQQMLVFFFFPRITPMVLFPVAMVLTCITAWGSWRFVEAPCLVLVRNRKAVRPTIMADQEIAQGGAQREAALIG